MLRPLADLNDPSRYPDLMRGLSSPDDAAVWRLNEQNALALTADFFPPVVDDPYHFGAIAAANALSDLYAMGARPLFGVNLVGFPDDLDRGVLTEILRGGAEKVRQAGAVVAGGHSTVDKEPKYGLAVVGALHPGEMLTNGGARPGDALFLTKPLGTGIVTTAHKKGKIRDDHLDRAIETMAKLNGDALGLLRSGNGAVHALTDVTGFSLAGHGHEMARESGVTLRVRWDAVGILPGVEGYARKRLVTGGGDRNRLYFGPRVRFERAIDAWQNEVLFDPQTSGGLLAAIGPERVEAVREAFREAKEPAWQIGEVVEGTAGDLVIC